MSTRNRKYPTVPYTVAPDVPFYVNRALNEVDEDVNTLDAGFRKLDTETRAEVAGIRWATEASAASAREAQSTATDLIPRVEHIETIAGLAPGEVTDAQTANLIAQPGTYTRDALNAASVQALKPTTDALTTVTEALDADKLDAAEAESTYLPKADAAITYATNASVRNELDERAAPIVADIISSDPTVAQSAAALAQSDAGLIRVTRLVTSTGNPLVFSALNNGRYQITRSTDATALGLPTQDHGQLAIERWVTSNGNPGMATWVTKPTPGKPSQFWSTEIANDGTAVAWTRDAAYTEVVSRLRVSRALTSAQTPLVFSALDTGVYQITRTTDAQALGLPTSDHGRLTVDRWTTSGGTPGMATWTTKPTALLGDTEVWSTEIDGTGNAVGWSLATGSGRSQSSEADMGLRHAYVSTRHAATIGGPIDVGTATPVCMTWDDYPGSFKAHGLAALAAQYEIPMTFAVPSRALDPGNEHLVGDGSVTWAEIDGWVQDGWVELANHSATHAANRTEADMYDEIVTALAELQAHSPTKPITTWVMPDNSWPDLNEGGDADGWASHAGQLILGHHAFATGKDSIRSDHTVPMTGVPFQGANRRWIEAEGLTDAIRQNLVSSSYGTNRGVILGAHPRWIGQGTRWTLAQVETFLAWLAAERDAGRVRPMFLSQWPWAKSSNPA